MMDMDDEEADNFFNQYDEENDGKRTDKYEFRERQVQNN